MNKIHRLPLLYFSFFPYWEGFNWPSKLVRRRLAVDCDLLFRHSRDDILITAVLHVFHSGGVEVPEDGSILIQEAV